MSYFLDHKLWTDNEEAGLWTKNSSLYPKNKIVGLTSNLQEEKLITDIRMMHPWIKESDLSLVRWYKITRDSDLTSTIILNVHN